MNFEIITHLQQAYNVNIENAVSQNSHIAMEIRTRKTQNSTLLLLAVPDNSASQTYLSSYDAQ